MTTLGMAAARNASATPATSEMAASSTGLGEYRDAGEREIDELKKSIEKMECSNPAHLILHRYDSFIGHLTGPAVNEISDYLVKVGFHSPKQDCYQELMLPTDTDNSRTRKLLDAVIKSDEALSIAQFITALKHQRGGGGIVAVILNDIHTENENGHSCIWHEKKWPDQEPTTTYQSGKSEACAAAFSALKIEPRPAEKTSSGSQDVFGSVEAVRDVSADKIVKCLQAVGKPIDANAIARHLQGLSPKVGADSPIKIEVNRQLSALEKQKEVLKVPGPKRPVFKLPS